MIKDLTELTKRKFIIVNIANEIGISKTAELFNHSRQTIRIWKKEFYKDGIEGLQNRSRLKQRFTNKMPDEIASRIIELKVNHPEYSAKKIKDVLGLNYSIGTIYEKLKQNSHLIKIKNDDDITNGTNCTSFSEFYVSVKKIQYRKKVGEVKLPKYIIFIEERTIGTTFCSFSNERTSFCIAIFLEYFLENLKNNNLCKKNVFHISSSIKLSSDDLLMQIAEDKYGCSIIPNSYMSDFRSYRSAIPYKYLYQKLFSRYNGKETLNSFSCLCFANLHMFNFQLLNNTSITTSNYCSEKNRKVEKLIFDMYPILTDSFITDVVKIKSNSEYFLNKYINKSNNEFYLRIKDLEQVISYLVTQGKKSEDHYSYKLAEDLFSASEIISRHYIKNILHYLSLNNFDHSELTPILKKIVLHLINSLSGLSYSYKLRGLYVKRDSYLKEAIELSEKYEFIEHELRLKNKLALYYALYQDKTKALGLIRYIIKHPQINKEQYFIVKITIGTYFFGKSNFKIAENVFSKILNEMGEQYPELKIRTLLNLTVLKIYTFRLDEIIYFLNEAVKCAKVNKIEKYNIRLNDHLGIYYSMNLMAEKSVKYYKKAIKLSSERGDVIFLNRSRANLGNLYKTIGKNDKAISIFKSILSSSQENKDYGNEISLLLNITRIYFDLKKYEIAEQYADKALFLSDISKASYLYFRSLIFKFDIHIEQLNIKSIVTIHQLLSKKRDQIENSSLDFLLKIINYNVEFLKLLFNYKLSKSKVLLREKHILDIFNRINLDIEKYKENNEQKAELTYLYCRLYKYLFNHSKKQKIKLKDIEEIVKDNYILNKNVATDLYITLSSKSLNVFYKNRLEEIKEFP